MTSDRHEVSSEDDPRKIEARIEETRSDISDTLNRLQDKLSPGQLMDQALDFVRKGEVGKVGSDFASNLGSVVRNNPVPLALIGVGIAWLAVSSASSRTAAAQMVARMGEADHQTGAATRNAAEIYGPSGQAEDQSSHEGAGLLQSAQEGVSQAAEGIRDKVGHLADRAQHAMTDLTTQAGAAFQSGKDAVAGQVDMGSLMRDQPLVVAGVGLALGALLGAALPGTEVENRVMGQAREDVVRQAKVLGREQLDRAEGAIEQVGDAMKDLGVDVKKGLREATDRARDLVDTDEPSDGGKPSAQS
jgi:ElaB/YqjD/DUF883 family membrane-anchored ribosome-binding protein